MSENMEVTTDLKQSTLTIIEPNPEALADRLFTFIERVGPTPSSNSSKRLPLRRCSSK
jgi:hypothetical protein